MTGSTGQERKTAALSGDRDFVLPPMAEERRIVTMIYKVDSLLHKRQEAILLGDEFLKAMFIDVFGDPLTNPLGWPTQRLASLGELDGAVSEYRPQNELAIPGGDNPLIETIDIANCDGYIRAFSNKYSVKGLKESKLWPKGTLCITITANTVKSGILLFPACFSDDVIGFSAFDRTTVEYVRFWLSFVQKKIKAIAPASAQNDIHLATLRELQIPVPSSDRTERFATVVSKIERIREAQRLARHESENLIKALKQQLIDNQLRLHQ